MKEEFGALPQAALIGDLRKAWPYCKGSPLLYSGDLVRFSQGQFRHTLDRATATDSYISNWGFEPRTEPRVRTPLSDGERAQAGGSENLCRRALPEHQEHPGGRPDPMLGQVP
jgi:hypothetical protein